MNYHFVDQKSKELTLVVSLEEDRCQLELDMELLELDDSSDNNCNVLFQCKGAEVQPQETSPVSTSGNRRYTLRPKKRTLYCDSDSLNSIVENVPSPTKKRCINKPKNGCLETIFEHPELEKNGNLLVLGKAKLKRFITFNDFVTKTKNKTRRLKVKRLQKHQGKKTKRPKITIEDVKLKLKCLEESNEENGSMKVAEDL